MVTFRRRLLVQAAIERTEAKCPEVRAARPEARYYARIGVLLPHM